MPELIEIEEARQLVLERASALQAEPIPLGEALGRVLAEDASAVEPVPAFDNSAMDGFAVRAADTRGAAPDSPVVLRIADESRAGRPASASLGAGEAIRISTGAMLPPPAARHGTTSGPPLDSCASVAAHAKSRRHMWRADPSSEGERF